MPSTASHLARVMHRQHLKNEADSRQFDQDKQMARAAVDQKFEDSREERLRLGDRAGFHAHRDHEDITKEDDARTRQRVQAVGQVIDKEAEHRATRKASQVKEIDAARKLPDQPGGHRPPAAPEQGDPVYLLWHRMNYAEKSEWHSIMGSHATRRDKVDEELVGGLQRRHRYSASTAEHVDRATDEHLKINRAEHSALQGIAATVRNRVMLDERRIEERNNDAREFHRKHSEARP